MVKGEVVKGENVDLVLTDRYIERSIKHRETGTLKLLFHILRWGKGVSSCWPDV